MPAAELSNATAASFSPFAVEPRGAKPPGGGGNGSSTTFKNTVQTSILKLLTSTWTFLSFSSSAVSAFQIFGQLLQDLHVTNVSCTNVLKFESSTL